MNQLQTGRLAVPHVSIGVATSQCNLQIGKGSSMSRCGKRGVVAGFSLTNPQKLSGPAASETLNTKFAETATVGI